MYPSIHSSSTVGVPSLSNQNHAVRDHQDFPEQPNARHFTANGPATLASANSSVLPVLRVRVAEQLSLTPPVMVSAQLGNIPRTDFAQSYDFEHQVLRDYPLDSQLPSAEGDTDTATAEIQRYTQLGHDREAVIMALVAVQTVVDKDTQVVKFLEEFTNLKAMGFASHIITGALIACPTDIAEATEACLSASS